MEGEGGKVAMPCLDFIRESLLPVGQGRDPGTAQILTSLGDTVWSSQHQSAFPGVTLLWGKILKVRD